MRRTGVALLAMVIAAAAGFGWSGSAAAAEDEEALIRRGLALRKHGNDEAALPVLEHAYALSHSPRAAAQLGFAEQALGLWPDAEAHVSEALGADTDPWVARNRAVVANALDTIRRHVTHTGVAAAPARPAPPATAPPPVVAQAPHLAPAVPPRTAPPPSL